MLSDDEFAAAGVAYREAKASIAAHLRVQSDAEIAVVDWLRAHRHVPVEKLYDPQTGVPVDKELAGLEAAVAKAAGDVQWCRALVVACGEVLKGRSLTDLLEAQGPRPVVGQMIGEN